MSEGSERAGGKTATQMQEEWLGRMSLHFGCAFCSWTFDGLLMEGRLEADHHRATEHPEIPPYRRKRHRNMMRPNWRSELSQEDRDEVNLERRKRANLHGIDITDDD